MLVARRFVVSGRVQGVGYRFFADEAARVEGLSGWIRNLPDGRVEAFAEGPHCVAVQQQLNRGARGSIASTPWKKPRMAGFDGSKFGHKR